MPKTSPPTKWTAEVESAIKVYSNRTGLEVLLYLKDHGPSTFGPIFENVTDRVRISVNRSLDRLEEIGVVVVDLPKGQRQYKQPKYDVDRDALIHMGLALANMFLDSGSTATVQPSAQATAQDSTS